MAALSRVDAKKPIWLTRVLAGWRVVVGASRAGVQLTVNDNNTANA
jgi:hypothetical protein